MRNPTRYPSYCPTLILALPGRCWWTRPATRKPQKEENFRSARVSPWWGDRSSCCALAGERSTVCATWQHASSWLQGSGLSTRGDGETHGGTSSWDGDRERGHGDDRPTASSI